MSSSSHRRRPPTTIWKRWSWPRNLLCLTVAANHRLANRESVYLRQAAAETFVGLTPNTAYVRCLIPCASKRDSPHHWPSRGEEHETLRGLVRAGLGITVLPPAPHHDPTLVEIPLRDREARRHVRAVWQKDRRLAPAARRFITFLTTSGTTVLRGG
jgi:DNA-binding transcriptional LysR family regulator